MFYAFEDDDINGDKIGDGYCYGCNNIRGLWWNDDKIVSILVITW